MITCSKNFWGRYGPLSPPLATAYVVRSTYPGLHNGFLHEFFFFIEMPVKSPVIVWCYEISIIQGVQM